GNQTERVFRAALRDPVIELERFHTNPAEPEESVRSEVHFDLLGDIDMVSTAEISIAQIQSGKPKDVTANYNSTLGSVFASFVNPKIRDLLPEGAAIAPVEMDARLRVGYGFGAVKVFDQAYTLYLDRTPPTLEIVSPGQGDFVAIGERTDVILKSFDKYGIERVEVQHNGGAWETLADPTRYSFVASEADLEHGITIAARATDPNNNVSPIQSVTLYPYDAEAGAPRVDILAPDNGTTFHEGEQVRFEVLLRNVVDAELFFDIGGVEAPASSAIRLTRASDGPERQFVTATLPAVDENIVVLARIQKANLKAYKFLNVVNDEGIEEEVSTVLLPATKILTGSELWVSTQVPSSMQDASPTSEVLVRDPAEQVTPIREALGGTLITAVSALGSQVEVETLLRDNSGHEKRRLHGLAK